MASLAIEQPSLNQVLRRVMIPPLVIMAVLASILLAQVYRLLVVNERVERSDQIIASAHELERLLVNMETGLRGYALTNADSFLQPYERSRNQIDSALKHLDGLVTDTELQHDRARSIALHYQTWLTDSEAVRAARVRGDEKAIDWEHSKQLMDSLRAEITAVIHTETAVRNDRSRAARQTTLTTVVLAVVFAVAAAILLTLSNRKQLFAVAARYDQMLNDARHAAEARRGIEDRFRRLLEGGTIGAAASDAMGNIIDANDAFLRMIGYDRADLESAKLQWANLTPPDFHALDDQARQELRSRGICNPYEKECVRKDGTRVPILIGSAQAEGQTGAVIAWTVDLASAKQAEQAIRQSESLLRSVTDALPVLVSYVDSEQRFRFNNKAYEAWFHQSHDQLRGKQIREVLGETAYADVEPHVKAALSGTPARFESKMMYPDQIVRDVSVEYVPQFSPDNTVEGFVALISDISERLRILNREKEIRVKAEMLTEIGKTISAELDLEKLVQRVTDIGRELSGAEFGAFFYNLIDQRGEHYTLYALSGAPVERFASFPMPRNTEIFAPTFRGEGIVRSDNITKDPRYGKNPPFRGMPDGHLPVKSYIAAPVISRNGEVLGALFFGHGKPAQFTEHHERLLGGIATQAAIAIDNARLVEALKTSEERFRKMANGAPVLIWLSGPDRRCYWFNKAWLDFTGRSLEEEQTCDWAASIHPDDRERSLAAYGVAFDEEQEFKLEYRLRRHDGNYRWIIDHGVPLYGAGREFTGFIGSCVDITERKLADQERDQILASERAARGDAERANRMKDEFLSNLSHELRTPLNAILGWADLLSLGQTGEEELRQGIDVIRRNARLQAHLIEDLLDMSRIISGKIRLDVQRIDVAEVIQQAVEAVRPAADAKGIQLQLTLGSVGRQVAGDPSRLQQIVWNLLSNAIKFTEKAGRVQVLLERVNSHIEITVADTGQGIKPEFLPYVFDRFRQADATTTRKYGGMGLGLAIVKQLVELHGGTVQAKSSGERQGATFVVTLPLTPVHAQEPASGRIHPRSPWPNALVAAETTRLDDLRVLVVDDEADARDLVKRILDGCNAQVQTAASTDEALVKLADNRFDVLISDIGMSQKDGYELIRTLRHREQGSGRQIPAIALTAFARSEDRQRALRAGFQMHVVKPVEPTELMVVVATVTGRQSLQT
jgi:PAS domain S-box-containing protein